MRFFCHFIEFGSNAFLEIAYNDSLGQWLTSSRGKTLKKILGAQIWAKQAKTGPEIRFFAIFSTLVHYFSFQLHRPKSGLNQAQNDFFFTIFLSLDHKFSLKLNMMIACGNF